MRPLRLRELSRKTRTNARLMYWIPAPLVGSARATPRTRPASSAASTGTPPVALHLRATTLRRGADAGCDDDDDDDDDAPGPSIVQRALGGAPFHSSSETVAGARSPLPAHGTGPPARGRGNPNKP
eukprot:scaffold1439_cov404-Prasinococcus_capsulatus_cf.AAC.39